MVTGRYETLALVLPARWRLVDIWQIRVCLIADRASAAVMLPR